MKHFRNKSWSPPLTRFVAAALVVYWAALCVGTHVPGRFVGTPLISDKVLHFSAYAGLSFLIATLLPLLGVQSWRAYGGALIVAVCYGAIDELGQIPIPGRTADIADWWADVAGAVAGLACCWLMMAAIVRRPRSRLQLQKRPSPP